jgi:hypothetical protein
MSTETPAKQSLTQLNREIEQLEAEASRLATERAAIARNAARAGRRFRYLRFLQWFRSPAAKFDMWSTAVLFAGPVIVGGLTLILVHLLTGSYPLAFFGFLLGMVAGAGLFAAFIFQPDNASLPSAIAQAETKSRLEQARLAEKTTRLSETNERLKLKRGEQREQIASGKLQRAALLQRNWKSMRDVEWEDYVVEVLRTHGFTVERSGRAGQDDPNLIVTSGNRRIAVLTQGEGHVANSATIQTVLAAKEHSRCDSCAVVINRRFTGAAQDFAKRNGCLAIGAQEFPDFVLGKIQL